ncbi:pre-mRNA-splicing factor 18 isoform X2, partial [Paramuricea clavata]
MDLWATDLNDRPQEVERSIEGKMAMATHRQTERYLKPLLRKLKAKATPSDILDFLIEIVGALLEREYVKDRYDPDARPVRNQSDSVRVELQMIYKELKEIDEPKQQMTSNTRFRIKWKDVSLQWKKEKYGGVKVIRLDPTRIWTPDLTLYN